MPIYTPKPLPYSSYVRSSSPAPFQTYSKQDCAICWLDLLGVHGLTHQQIVSTVKDILHSASEASCTGIIDQQNAMIGTPNTAIQYSIVGDAVILAEKNTPETPSASKLGFFYRVNLLSRFLNQKGYLHRGVITTGEVDCFVDESATIITGAGVVKAHLLESGVKTAGLFFDDSWDNFLKVRQKQLDLKSFIVPFNLIPNWNASQHAANLSGVSISQFDGWDHWKNVVNAGLQSINKVSNAQSLILELKTTFSLP